MRHLARTCRPPTLLFCVLVLSLSAHAQITRSTEAILGDSNSNWVPRLGTDNSLVVSDLNSGLTPVQLAQSILAGVSVTISNVSYSGVAVSAGTFTTTQPGVIGFGNGIILSSGNVSSVIGPNLQDSTSTDNGLGGDANLQSLIPNHVVYDATVLEFDFVANSIQAGQTGSLNFNFVFSSEEYNEWVNTAYNDVFGFFLNGQNIALLQDLQTTVQIDTVNGGNPYGPPPSGINWNQFRNNDLSDGGGAIDTEMDGLTIVLTAHGQITGPGPHHIKLAIADAGDHIYDSNVFIQGSSLVATSGPSCVAPTPTSTLTVTAQQPISWEVRAVANHGQSGALVTIQPPSASFAAAFTGPPVSTPNPLSHSPVLPVFGQPASSIVTWTPPLSAVGEWIFTYGFQDNLGQLSSCQVVVQVVPTSVSSPTCIAPTPVNELRTTIGFPISWTLAAVSNSGLPGAEITIHSVSVEFDENFGGNSVPVNSPVQTVPGLGATGQPASISVTWTPPLSAIGQWDFDYHLIDHVGQTSECTISVLVEDAALVIGANSLSLPLGTDPLDFLHVDPVFFFPISESDQPEIIVPNVPWIAGLDIFTQVIRLNPFVDAIDPIKTSPTIRFRLAINSSPIFPGNGLDLIATGLPELGESLPYEYIIL